MHLRGLDAQCIQSAPTSDNNSASTNGTDGSSRVLRALFTQFSWTRSGFSVRPAINSLMRRKPIDNRVQLPRSSFFNQRQFDSTSHRLGGATEQTKQIKLTSRRIKLTSRRLGGATERIKLTKHKKNRIFDEEDSEETSEDTPEALKKAESTNGFTSSIQDSRNQD